MKWFMEEERAGQENYDMLAERDKGFKDQDRRKVSGRRHDGNGLSAQALDTTFDVALRTY